MIETRLHEILSLERPLLFFDLETTGTDDLSARIVEIGLIQIKPDGAVKAWRSLVNPEIPIPAEATAKHNITDAMVQGCSVCNMERENPQHLAACPDDAGAHDFKPWPTFKAIASNLLIGFSNTDFGGFNLKRYDLPLLRNEFKRIGVEWDFTGAGVLDGARLWQLADPRSLADFYRRWTGKELENAHSADADIAGTLEAVEGLIRQVAHLPRKVNDLHDLQWPERVQDPSWLDKSGKFRVVDGKVVIGFGKHKGTDIKLVPKKYWSFFLSDKVTDFPEDALTIIRELLVGKWPSVPAAKPADAQEATQ